MPERYGPLTLALIEAAERGELEPDARIVPCAKGCGWLAFVPLDHHGSALCEMCSEVDDA